MIKIPRSDSGAPEELNTFVDLVHKSLIEQNGTTGPSMYRKDSER